MRARGPPPFRTVYETIPDWEIDDLDDSEDPKTYFFYPEIGIPHGVAKALEEQLIRRNRAVDHWERGIACPVRAELLPPCPSTPVYDPEEETQGMKQQMVVLDRTPLEHVMPKESKQREDFQSRRHVEVHTITTEGPIKSTLIQDIPSPESEGIDYGGNSPSPFAIPSPFSLKVEHSSSLQSPGMESEKSASRRRRLQQTQRPASTRQETRDFGKISE